MKNLQNHTCYDNYRSKFYFYRWLKHVATLHDKGTLTKDDYITWAAYHASAVPQPNIIASPNCLLPLFHEDSKSVAMMKHGMSIIQQATKHLNPGQIPVVTADQPLFALAKKIQWSLKKYGEDKFVVMMGSLHIEMAVMKVIGDWVTDSGWAYLLSKANVATIGSAESFEDVSHVTKTRYAHHVTAAALHILQTQAYELYSNESNDDVLSMEEWIKQQESIHPQFKYWNTALQLELLAFIFVRSIREGKFLLYLQTIKEILPWFFALDHVHYARWLSVHLCDMSSLHVTHPTVYKEFLDGKFVGHKSRKSFSGLATDQIHEQNNAKVKGNGGAIGLFDTPNALRRDVGWWQVLNLLD